MAKKKIAPGKKILKKKKTDTRAGRRVVRVVCRLKEEVSDEHPLTFEVVLSGTKIVSGMAFLGFQGTLNGELNPFVLLPDGRLDFGVSIEADDRFTLVNILSKQIEVGAMLTTEEYDPDTGRRREYVYAITQIVPVGP